MFKQIRYQTGEIKEIIEDMKCGKIPCMDVDNNDEYEWFLGQLELNSIYKVKALDPDKYARDRVLESEFEFRVAFSDSPIFAQNIDVQKLMYIDFYFEPIEDETYDSIFGD